MELKIIVLDVKVFKRKKQVMNKTNGFTYKQDLAYICNAEIMEVITAIGEAIRADNRLFDLINECDNMRGEL